MPWTYDVLVEIFVLPLVLSRRCILVQHPRVVVIYQRVVFHLSVIRRHRVAQLVMTHHFHTKSWTLTA